MKIAYVIGRFQPFHNGHKALIDTALRVADQVMVVIGDTGCAPDHRDPWSVAEREQMIRACYPEASGKLLFASVQDIPYDDLLWAKQVEHIVRAPLRPEEQVLVGFKKDASSFYLDMFPDWDFVQAELGIDGGSLSATKVRERLYDRAWTLVLASVPRAVFDILSAIDSHRLDALSAEHRAAQEAVEDWACPASSRWGYIGTAVDAVAHTKEHLLVIERGGEIGRGTLALPGGFVGVDERLHVAALRELFEETGLDLRAFEHRYAKPGSMVPFDAVKRSSRGRIVTSALNLELPGDIDAYEVKAGDDAATVSWIHKSALWSPHIRRRFFSDHWHIATHFVI